ncbi:MAG: glycosyltransferase [Solirubrobacteraceae bacterium]
MRQSDPASAPAAPLEAAPARPTISAYVVARNEQRLIARCLSSFADLVDEIIFVHDGECEDRTLEIAEQYGCRIYVQPYRGHADAAKVFALNQARCEWILGVDADEFLSDGLREHLHELVSDPDVNGYGLLWPFWDGRRYVSSPQHSWHKLQLYRRSAVHAVGNLHLTVNVDPPVLDVDYHLEHRPEYNNWTLRTNLTKWRAWARVGAREYLTDYSEFPTFNWQGPTAWPPRRHLLNRLSPVLFVLYPSAVLALEVYRHSGDLSTRRNVSMAFNGAIYAMMLQFYVAKFLYWDRSAGARG